MWYLWLFQLNGLFLYLLPQKTKWIGKFAIVPQNVMIFEYQYMFALD
ncbi:hypothetical protein XBI1_630001 [Xenorhabdus bovienii str. Intermedium]|uniref:Uncharacterized protein n=1 Tax=Xenorhabdus bovienii str. Intermedium TaxID=1379677 RepID=A0A077QQP5_XENBV|nr:hypothetical protein XBI1_630001 [Xenorhabdus bovienii str. Intermedium]